MTNNIFHITTPRLIIRKYRAGDAKMLKDAYDVSIDHLKPWMPWAKDGVKSLSETQAVVEDWITKFETNQDFYYGIFDKDNSKLIGSTGLHTRLGKHVFEIGYWIRQDETRKGYATESSYALSKIGLNYLGAEKIEIRCDPENTISSRVPAKLGYKHEYSLRSFLRDEKGERLIHDCWTLFKEEFKQRSDYEPIVINQY